MLQVASHGLYLLSGISFIASIKVRVIGDKHKTNGILFLFIFRSIRKTASNRDTVVRVKVGPCHEFTSRRKIFSSLATACSQYSAACSPYRDRYSPYTLTAVAGIIYCVLPVAD